MCLYPKLILNPKYRANKKNGGIIPPLQDERVKYVAVGCGKCIECCHQKANGWRQRLREELKVTRGKFITLTFSEESIKELAKELEVEGQCNAIAGLAVRRFLERWRKKHGKSVKHFFITELGSKDKTERLHLHGIMFTDSLTNENLTEMWKYGKVDIGNKCNEKSINYIVKYIHKPDTEHPNYQPQTFCSAGIGKKWTEGKEGAYKFRGEQTREYYTLEGGQRISLSMYYRNHFFNEEEREKLWIQRLNKQERWVRGLRIDISESEDRYWAVLKDAQEENRRLGFPEPDWERCEYSKTMHILKKERSGDLRRQSVRRGLHASHVEAKHTRQLKETDSTIWDRSNLMKMQAVGKLLWN